MLSGNSPKLRQTPITDNNRSYSLRRVVLEPESSDMYNGISGLTNTPLSSDGISSNMQSSTQYRSSSTEIQGVALNFQEINDGVISCFNFLGSINLSNLTSTEDFASLRVSSVLLKAASFLIHLIIAPVSLLLRIQSKCSRVCSSPFNCLFVLSCFKVNLSNCIGYSNSCQKHASVNFLKSSLLFVIDVSRGKTDTPSLISKCFNVSNSLEVILVEYGDTKISSSNPLNKSSVVLFLYSIPIYNSSAVFISPPRDIRYIGKSISQLTTSS